VLWEGRTNARSDHNRRESSRWTFASTSHALRSGGLAMPDPRTCFSYVPPDHRLGSRRGLGSRYPSATKIVRRRAGNLWGTSLSLIRTCCRNFIVHHSALCTSYVSHRVCGVAPSSYAVFLPRVGARQPTNCKVDGPSELLSAHGKPKKKKPCQLTSVFFTVPITVVDSLLLE